MARSRIAPVTPRSGAADGSCAEVRRAEFIRPRRGTMRTRANKFAPTKSVSFYVAYFSGGSAMRSLHLHFATAAVFACFVCVSGCNQQATQTPPAADTRAADEAAVRAASAEWAKVA